MSSDEIRFKLKLNSIYFPNGFYVEFKEHLRDNNNNNCYITFIYLLHRITFIILFINYHYFYMLYNYKLINKYPFMNHKDFLKAEIQTIK